MIKMVTEELLLQSAPIKKARIFLLYPLYASLTSLFIPVTVAVSPPHCCSHDMSQLSCSLWCLCVMLSRLLSLGAKLRPIILSGPVQSRLCLCSFSLCWSWGRTSLPTQVVLFQVQPLYKLPLPLVFLISDKTCCVTTLMFEFFCLTAPLPYPLV